MTKVNLKTLKDIEVVLYNNISYNDDDFRDGVDIDNLRQAAKEWVKHYEKMMKQYDTEYDREMYLYNVGKRAAIIDFFNLEDE